MSPHLLKYRKGGIEKIPIGAKGSRKTSLTEDVALGQFITCQGWQGANGSSHFTVVCEREVVTDSEVVTNAEWLSEVVTMQSGSMPSRTTIVVYQ